MLVSQLNGGLLIEGDGGFHPDVEAFHRCRAQPLQQDLAGNAFPGSATLAASQHARIAPCPTCTPTKNGRARPSCICVSSKSPGEAKPDAPLAPTKLAIRRRRVIEVNVGPMPAHFGQPF